MGRAAGATAGYDFSPSMKSSGKSWDDAAIMEFLKAPKKYVPGTKMAFAGLKKENERADLVAYLTQSTA